MNRTIAQRLNTNAAALSAIALPNVGATQDCIIGAINEFRQSVSVASAERLQTTVTNCLTDLQTQTNAALTSVIVTGVDPFKSDFTLDAAIQFTTKPIVVSVSLNEAGGNSVTNNLPTSVAESVAEHISATITLGDVGKFVYDGYGQFTAPITSIVSGNGTIQVSFDDQLISILNNPTDTTVAPSVTTKELLYTFVQSSSLSTGTGGEPGSVRRDEGDVSRDGSNGGD